MSLTCHFYDSQLGVISKVIMTSEDAYHYISIYILFTVMENKGFSDPVRKVFQKILLKFVGEHDKCTISDLLFA